MWRRKLSERIAPSAYKLLRNKEIRGTAKDVADLLGIPVWQFQLFARDTRTEDWLEEYGWKVDYRGHGAKPHIPWTISHVDDVPSINARNSGDRCRKSAERKIRTASLDYSVYLAQTIEGTIERRKAQLIAMELRHLVEKIEALAA